MYRLLFFLFVGAVCVVNSTNRYGDSEEYIEYIRQEKDKLQKFFDEWLRQKMMKRTDAVKPVFTHPAAAASAGSAGSASASASPSVLSDPGPEAAFRSRTRYIDASQQDKRGHNQPRSEGTQSHMWNTYSFKDIAEPAGHGSFQLFHFHKPNGDQDSWSHNDNQDFSYLFSDKPNPSPVRPPNVPSPPQNLPKPVYGHAGQPAYYPSQQGYPSYQYPTNGQPQPQPCYQYQPSYQSYNNRAQYLLSNQPCYQYPSSYQPYNNREQYPLSNNRQPRPVPTQTIPYPYQQAFPVYQDQAAQPPVYSWVPVVIKAPISSTPAPVESTPLQTVTEPTLQPSEIPVTLPPTTKSTPAQPPRVTTTESTEVDLASEEKLGTTLSSKYVPSTVEETTHVPVHTTTAATKETGSPHLETTGASYETTVVENTHSTVEKYTEAPVYTSTVKEETVSSYEETTVEVYKSTFSATTNLPYKPEETTGAPVYTTSARSETEATVTLYGESHETTVSNEFAPSTVGETTDVPVYTTTEGSETENTVSLYDETTKESLKTTVSSENAPSTAVETTFVPTTTERIETANTVSPYNGTTEESLKTTVSSENAPSTAVETTFVPTTTERIETANTVSPYNGTTEESLKTTVRGEYAPSTVEESTSVPVYTTTERIETEKTVSSYYETTEESHKTTLDSDNTYSTVGETTDAPVHTTTVKALTEDAGSLPEETAEEDLKTTAIENTHSSVEEPTGVPVYTTTVKGTEKPVIPHEETTQEYVASSEESTSTEEAYKTTFRVENSTSKPVESTMMPVYSTEPDFYFEATKEKDQKSVNEYTHSTVVESTEVPAYTSTVKIGFEETVSPDENPTELGLWRSAEDLEEPELVSEKKTNRKGIVRREDGSAKRREEQRIIAHSHTGSNLDITSNSLGETGRGHISSEPVISFEKRLLRKLTNTIVRELRQGTVSNEEKARLKEAFGDMWYSIVNEAFKYVPVELPDDEVPKIANRVLEYLLKGTPLARRLNTPSVKGRSIRLGRDTSNPRLEPWQEVLLRAVMTRPLTPHDEQKGHEILTAIKEQLQAPQDDFEFADEEADDNRSSEVSETRAAEHLDSEQPSEAETEEMTEHFE